MRDIDDPLSAVPVQRGDRDAVPTAKLLFARDRLQFPAMMDSLLCYPDRFEPARFLPGAEPAALFSYLPFGIGPRACIGAQFALTEAVLVLARLVREFPIELAEDRPVPPIATITLQPDHSPPFRLAPR